MGQGGFNRVAGAELLVLFHPNHIGVDALAHQIFAVADHHTDAFRAQALCGADHARQHAAPADFMQHFGQLRIHARAFTGSQNNDI